MYLLNLKPDLLSSLRTILALLAGYVHAQGQVSTGYDLNWVRLPNLTANRSINDVFQDQYGVLWIGCKSGLYRYDGVNAERHHLFRDDAALSQPVRSIKEDLEGNLWIATEKGLKILDPTRSHLLPVTAFHLPDSLADIPANLTYDPGTSPLKNSEAFSVPKNVTQNYSEQLDLVHHFVQNKISSGTSDESGFVISQMHKLPNDVSVFETSEGIFLVSPKKNNFKKIRASVGKIIRAIQSDCFGHLIYSSYNDIWWQYPEDDKAHFFKSDHIPWVIQPTNKEKNRFFWEDAQDGKKQLVYIHASKQGVFFEQRKDIPGSDSTTVFTALCIAEDALRNGIWHYLHRNNHFQLLFYDIQEDRHYFLNRMKMIDEPRGMIAGKDLWLGGPGGLKCFVQPDPHSGVLQEDNSKIPAVIRNLSVLCMYSGTGDRIWLGADDQGLYGYDPGTGQYERFTTNEGLPENSVFSIVGESGDSVLWLGTGKGLSRFDIRRRQFENFYVEDGLAGNEFNTAAAYRAPDGTIYMGGQNGITSFYPDNFKSIIRPLRQTACFSLIKASNDGNDEQFILKDGDLLQVAPGIQLLQISFHTDDYMHATQQQFRYRIPGVISQWQTLNYVEKALLPWLPSGTYRLEVQTKNYRGVWQPPVRYTLDILPPWYATWWFRSLVLLGIAILLYRLYLLRIRFLRREFSLRQQISHDLHDELGSRIFLLRTLSHKIANPLLPDAEKQADLNRFEATSQETFKSIRDFIWAFDPKQDEAQHLFDRMDDFAENYLSPVIDTVQIHRSNIPPGAKIGPRVKHHLMNIYQELLTNMVKHTQSEEINIYLSLSGSTLVVEIYNRHKGFRGTRSEQTEIQLGRESLQYRLAEINATMVWEAPDEHLQSVSLTIGI